MGCLDCYLHYYNGSGVTLSVLCMSIQRILETAMRQSSCKTQNHDAICTKKVSCFIDFVFEATAGIT